MTPLPTSCRFWRRSGWFPETRAGRTVLPRRCCGSRTFSRSRRNLGLVDVVWVGQAVRAYRDEFGLQPAAFKDTAVALHDAGYALGSHAIALDSARKAAAAALDVFQRGVRAAHDAGTLSIAAAGGLLPPSGPLDLRAALVGLQDRLSSIEKLDAAPDHLNQPGSKAARTLRDAMATAPQQATAAEHAVNFAGLAS